MSKRIILMGKSCSGKTTLAEKLNSEGFNIQLSTTSRPQRSYEKNGKDYNFVSKEKFEQMISENKFVEYDKFNGWYYGLEWDIFNSSDILIQTPGGLKKLLEKFKKEDFLIIYIETSTQIRLERNKVRGDTHDDINRRWVSDDIDFDEFEKWGGTWDLKISIQDNNAIDNLIKIIKLVK